MERRGHYQRKSRKKISKFSKLFFILWQFNDFFLIYFHHNKINDFRERREAEQRERDRQEKERMEKERLQREHRERQERERQERERQREKQLSAVEAVDHHFQLSMELAKKVSPSPQIFRYYLKKNHRIFLSFAPP